MQLHSIAAMTDIKDSCENDFYFFFTADLKIVIHDKTKNALWERVINYDDIVKLFAISKNMIKHKLFEESKNIITEKFNESKTQIISDDEKNR